MNDSSLRLEPGVAERLVRRPVPPNGTGAFLNDDDHLDIPSAYAGVNTTARDVAAFGQMFLNGGGYGDQRILSRSSVEAMTRNQIPEGVPEVLPWIASSAAESEPSYGYGWFIQGHQRWPMNGALLPMGVFMHGGFGGTAFWVDPQNDIVGVILSVATWDDDAEPPDVPPKLNAAAFQDMVTAATTD